MSTGELMRGTGLQALWHFNGDLNDSSANGYNLTDVSTTDVVAKFGKGRNLVAASSQSAYIINASCANLNIIGSRTIVAWVKPTSITSGARIVDKDDDTAGYAIFITAGSQFSFYARGLTTNIQVTNAQVTPVVGQWYCLVAIYDSAEGLLKMWVNGVKETIASSGSSTNDTKDFAIGSHNGTAGVGASNFFDGVIDEVAVYNRAWSDAEVKRYYAWSKGRMTKII